jgi:hypothetical protein
MNNNRRRDSSNLEDIAASASPTRFFEEDEEDECDFMDHDDDCYSDQHHTPMNLFSDGMLRGERLPLLEASALDKISLLPPRSDETIKSDNLIPPPAAASDLVTSSDNTLLDAPVSIVEEDFRSFKIDSYYAALIFSITFTRPFCR